jgi:hypothetical protein
MFKLKLQKLFSYFRFVAANRTKLGVIMRRVAAMSPCCLASINNSLLFVRFLTLTIIKAQISEFFHSSHSIKRQHGRTPPDNAPFGVIC